jgi:hypothetical protein
MRRRLQITMKAEDLKQGIERRLADLAAKAAALDGRLEARAGDSPFDVREEDDYMSAFCRSTSARTKPRKKSGALCVFIREHVEADEVYRLGRADLEFGDLLPDKPGSLKQKEYEEQTQLAFSEERLAKKL